MLRVRGALPQLGTDLKPQHERQIQGLDGNFDRDPPVSENEAEPLCAIAHEEDRNHERFYST